MIQGVRSKVASKISKIKEADDFNFSNWLKKPLQQDHPIEPLTSYVSDFEKALVEFVPADFYQYKFDMSEPEVTDELKNCEFQKVKSNAIFFMIALPMEKGLVFSQVGIKHKSYQDKKIEFLISNPRIRNFKVLVDSIPRKNFEFKFELPVTVNHLQNLVAEIYNIELLDIEDLISSAKKVKVEIIGLDKFKKTKIEKISVPDLPISKKTIPIKVPSMGNYKFSEQKISFPEFSPVIISNPKSFDIKKVRTWYANVSISNTESFLLYQHSKAKNVSEKDEKSKAKKIPSHLSEQLGMILSNVRKVDWEKSGRYLTKLKPHEEVSTKYLVENNHALLQEEFGIDSQKEIIAALKLLFTNRIIKSALILSDHANIGNIKAAKNIDIEIGWSDRLKKYCPELTQSFIQGGNDERADLWSKSKSVIISDIDTALNDYRLKILEEKVLQKFDCIILDSVDQVLLRKEIREEFLSSIHPDVLWATTNVLDRNLVQELNTLLESSTRIQKLLIRNKQTVGDSLPRFLIDEFWSYSDEHQIAEFKTALTDCKKELRRVLESGNPLRFYANIFTLYHKLNQISNFASSRSASPKSELLLQHLSIIKENKKRALVLSQYEKLGIKKITELLNNAGIKHIVAPNSLSVEEMQKAVLSFQTQNDVVAFVTDAKTSRLRSADFNVSYVIKFDQWWNPIFDWEMEDIILKDGDGAKRETINLCNYYLTGTLDDRMREILIDGDLLNRNLFELMQPKLYEELVTVDEWLQVFGMPLNEEQKTENTPETVQTNLEKITIDSFRNILSRLFKVLGYSEIEILELPNSNSFNLTAKSQRNGRPFFLNANVFAERKIDKKAIDNILSETSKLRKDKIFIITRGSFPKFDESKLRENVTMLDGLALSKLLIRVGILPTAP